MTDNSYLNFGEKKVDQNDFEEVIKSYDEGFVFGRTEIGAMARVRSLRVNLKDFEPSSENRRVLRKYSHEIKVNPVPFENYTWEIHKLGKDFYDQKFGEGTFSANKIKELFTTQHNFNSILTFEDNYEIHGYCICFQSEISNQKSKIIHYAYPFYQLNLINSSFGIFMMTKAISYFKKLGFDYIYLGSVHDEKSFYKLQFKGLEWWDEKSEKWENDLELLKKRITS